MIKPDTLILAVPLYALRTTFNNDIYSTVEFVYILSSLVLVAIIEVSLKYTTDNEAPVDIRLNSQDKKLMNTIRVFLMDNISNAKFKINSLADHAHIEGRTLERKMNALAGKSPKAYFYRDEVGYQSSASFSRKFKAKFGITPNEFQKKG